MDGQSELAESIDRDRQLGQQLRDLNDRLGRATGDERATIWEQREAVLDELDVRTEERAQRRRWK